MINFHDLQEAGARYSNYPGGEFKDIPFYEPDTEELSKRAEKMKNNTLKKMYLAAGIFLLFLIMGIAANNSIKGIIIMSVMTALLIILCIYMKSKKPKIAVGTAVFKYDEGKVGTRQKHYYVSVLVEGVIYKRIPIRKKDYDNVEEGTQILIEKVSGRSCVL